MSLATTTTDPVLVDALDRVRELSLRLWAVRAAHGPVRSRLGRVRCGTCGQAFPCPTLRAAGPQNAFQSGP
ncbi:MAG: hypothetical protein JWO60_33 [Frankiales bacterium]|nr:hypothetical protein [Frankiales bacterium]